MRRRERRWERKGGEIEGERGRGRDEEGGSEERRREVRRLRKERREEGGEEVRVRG